MPRLTIAAAIFAALLIARPALAQDEQQSLVDRSTLAVQEILAQEPNLDHALNLLRRSRAIMVCPRVFRAGFIIGGEGGYCVLLARDGAGSWSSPAFYSIGSASIGFQAGAQDMQVMMMILTDRGLGAVLDSQYKIGGDASVSFANMGVGVEGATTAAAGADIVTIARTRGLYAGVTLEGSLLTSESAFNRRYYGRDVGARQIVIGMGAHNPGSDPLRAILIRHSQRDQAQPAGSAAAQGGGGGDYAPRTGAAAPGPGTVGRETLSPPPRR